MTSLLVTTFPSGEPLKSIFELWRIVRRLHSLCHSRSIAHPEPYRRSCPLGRSKSGQPNFCLAGQFNFAHVCHSCSLCRAPPTNFNFVAHLQTRLAVVGKVHLPPNTTLARTVPQMLRAKFHFEHVLRRRDQACYPNVLHQKKNNSTLWGNPGPITVDRVARRV